MTVADPKRQSRRQRQVGPAAVRANTGIRLGMSLIQIVDHDVPKCVGLSIQARQAAHLHNGIDLLSQETTPAVRYRLGLEESVDDPCLLSRSNLTRLARTSASARP